MEIDKHKEDTPIIATFGDWTWIYGSDTVVMELVAYALSFVAKPPATENPDDKRSDGYVLHDEGACTSYEFWKKWGQ